MVMAVGGKSYINIGLLNSFEHHPVGGDIIATGVQYSAEVVTVDADTDYAALSVTLDNGQLAEMVEIYASLTLALKAGSATADAKYKWQMRNKTLLYADDTWVDLADYVTIANIGTSYVEYTLAGYITTMVANLKYYPVNLQLLIQSNETTPGVATAKVKNSSIVTFQVK